MSLTPQDALRHEYGQGVAHGMRTTLRLLLGRATDGAPPFSGPLTAEVEAWAREALSRVEAEVGQVREDWPIHQPEATDAPIPGRHWYAGCEPADYDSERGYHGPGPRVNPATGICEGCGATACRVCGRENCPDDHEDASRLVR